MADKKLSIKDIIKIEYKKCATDPVYFMKKYCMIQHPVRGKIAFHLFPFQERVLGEFTDNRYNIVLKSRQTGISTLVAGFSLWKMLFNEDFNTLVIATKQEVAKNLVTKVRYMNQNLPTWLRQTAIEDNKLSLRYSNLFWCLMRQLSLTELKTYGYPLNPLYQQVVTLSFYPLQMVLVISSTKRGWMRKKN